MNRPVEHQAWPPPAQSSVVSQGAGVKQLLVHENSMGWWRVFDGEDSAEPIFRSDRLRTEDRAREICRAEGGGTVRVVNHRGEQVAEHLVQPVHQPRRTGAEGKRRDRTRGRWSW